MPVIRFAKAVALAAVLLGSALAGGAQAQTIELKLSHFVPPNHTFHKWALAWAEQLAKESNGRLKVTIYPNGQLVGPPNRQFDAARNGITDMAFVLHGVTPGRYPVTELGNLPFAWPKAGSGSAMTSKRLAELAPTYLAKEHEGLHILFMAVAMPDRRLFQDADPQARRLQGREDPLRRRAEHDPVDAHRRSAAADPAAGVAGRAGQGHHRRRHRSRTRARCRYDLGAVAKHAIEPGMATAPFAFVMNPAKYNSLPADLKALIDKTTGPAAAEQFGKQWEAAGEIRRARSIKQGVQIHTLSDADVAEIKKRMAPQIEEAIAARREGRQAGPQVLRGIHRSSASA